MNRYTLTLDEGQLKLLHQFLATGVDQLQKNITEGHRVKDPVVHADVTIDAFSRGPRLVALLEEHLALGPEPTYQQSG